MSNNQEEIIDDRTKDFLVNYLMKLSNDIQEGKVFVYNVDILTSAQQPQLKDMSWTQKIDFSISYRNL